MTKKCKEPEIFIFLESVVSVNFENYKPTMRKSQQEIVIISDLPITRVDSVYKL